MDTQDVSGYTVGTVYMNNLSISAAEMTQYLSNIRMCGTNCLTKRFRAPYFSYVLQDKVVIKDLHRSNRFHDKNLMQYIRLFRKPAVVVLEIMCISYARFNLHLIVVLS